MTRETKVGLAVAGSFVCLVSVVVASRLNRKPDAAPPDQQLAHAEIPKSDPAAAAIKPIKPKAAAAETKVPIAPPLAPNPPGPMPNTEIGPSLPSGTNQRLSGTAFNNAKKKNAISTDLGNTAAAEAEQEKRKRELSEAKAKETESITPPPILPGHTLEDPIQNAANSPTDAPMLPAVTGVGMDKNGLPTADANVAKTGTNIPPPVRRELVGPPPPTEAEKALAALEATAPPLPAPPPSVSVPPLPAPQPIQPAAVQVADIIPKPSPPSAFKDLTNPNLAAMGSVHKANPLPPLAAAPSGVKPTSLTAPQVISFTTQRYLCRPEDTSFEAVSAQNYGSPKYARALLEYNRNDPRTKENLRQDNPRLASGQEVYIPPLAFLQSRYASLIDNRTIAPVAAVSISAPAGNGAPSAPNATPTIGRTPTPPPTNDATKSYRVSGDGQMLIEIAQQTLGDRGRWSEIYRLNPTIRPEYPVPGGTELRLPNNANVP